MPKTLLSLLAVILIFSSFSEGEAQEKRPKGSHRRPARKHRYKRKVPQIRRVPVAAPLATCAASEVIPGWTNFRGVEEDPAHSGELIALGWAPGGSFGRIYHSALTRGTRGPDGKITWSAPIELPSSTSYRDHDSPTSLKVAPDGSIWVATARGLFVSEGKDAPFKPVARFAGMHLTTLSLVTKSDGSYRVMAGTRDFIPPGTTPPSAAGDVFVLEDPSKPEEWVSTGFKAHIAAEKARLDDNGPNPRDPDGSIPMRGEQNGGHSISTLISSITPDPRNPGSFFVGTGNHVHRFTPGRKWEGLYKGVLNDSLVYGVTVRSGALHMATCNGLYAGVEAPDGSVTWRKESVNGRVNTANTGVLASKPEDSNFLVAVNDPLGQGLGPRGILVSSNNGTRWGVVPGTESVRGDHLGGDVEFLEDGSFFVTGDKLTHVSTLTPTQACGPTGPVESSGRAAVATTGGEPR